MFHFQLRFIMSTEANIEQTALEHIPVELWKMIIYRSAGPHMHGALDTSPLPPFSFELRSWMWDDRWEDEIEVDVSTKLSLVQVCKHWRVLALPLLYERVVLTTAEQLEALMWTLETSHSGASDIYNGSFRIAHFIKRVVFRQGNTWHAHQYGPLRSMFALCSGLKIIDVHFDHSQNVGAALMKYLESANLVSNPVNLRSIEHADARFLSCLPYLARLEALTLYPLFFAPPTNTKISLPLLHSLSMSDISKEYIKWIATWDMPLLSCLQFSGGNEYIPLLESVGPTITALTFKYCEYSSLLSDHCPSLQHLLVDFTHFSRRLKPGKHLRGINLSVLPRHPTSHRPFGSLPDDNIFTSILDTVVAHIYRTPGLSITFLRLEEFFPSYFYSKRWAQKSLKRWKNMVRMSQEANVRFEDGCGNIITVPDDV
jgi:hypothetical protein